MRHAGHDRHDSQQNAADEECLRLRQKLRRYICIQAALRYRSGYDHTGCSRNQKRGNLGNQTVTDRCNRIDRQNGAKVHAALHHTDDAARRKVDCRDDDGHDRVTLYDLRRTIHRAVEIRFLLDLMSADFCLLLRNQTGAEVRVDRHLLTGHRVQRKSCRNLGNAFRALGDNDKLHQYDNQEYDYADNRIALQNEGADGGDNLPRLPLLCQDQSGRGNIQPDTKERRNQKERGEYGKFQRLLDVHRNQQNNQRNRNIQYEKDIQYEWIQWY